MNSSEQGCLSVWGWFPMERLQTLLGCVSVLRVNRISEASKNSSWPLLRSIRTGFILTARFAFKSCVLPKTNTFTRLKL